MKLPHACPSCGRTLPRDWLALGSNTIPMRGKQRILYDAVLKSGDAGISRDRLMDLMYGDDPNGGPDSYNTFSAIIRHINNKLEKAGRKIKSTGMGQGEHFYVLGDL